MECILINQLQTFANSDSGNATREGSPLVQLNQPATQILTPLSLQQRRWDRPLVHGALCHSQVSVDSAICDHPSHKICNSLSEDCQRVIVRLHQVPISTASQQFCLWLSCFEHGQPVCPQKDPNPNPITGDALLQIIASTKIQAPGR